MKNITTISRMPKELEDALLRDFLGSCVSKADPENDTTKRRIMKNWRNVDDEYHNFDHFDHIYVKPTARDDKNNVTQWGIHVSPCDPDGYPFELFNKQFETRMEAAKYLSDFMEEVE